MANLTLTIPDLQATRILNGFCAHHDYQDTIDGLPNPETKLAFTKRIIYWLIKRDVVEYEAVEAQRAAIAASNTDINL